MRDTSQFAACASHVFSWSLVIFVCPHRPEKEKRQIVETCGLAECSSQFAHVPHCVLHSVAILSEALAFVFVCYFCMSAASGSMMGWTTLNQLGIERQPGEQVPIQEQDEHDVGTNAVPFQGCLRSSEMGLQHCSWCSLGVTPEHHMNLFEAVMVFQKHAVAQAKHEQRVEGMDKWMQVARTAQLLACITEVQAKRREEDWMKALESLQSQNMLIPLKWKPDELKSLLEEIWWVKGFVATPKPPAARSKPSKKKAFVGVPSFEDPEHADWRYEARVPATGVRIVEIEKQEDTWIRFEAQATMRLLDFYDKAEWGESRLIQVEIETQTYGYNYKIEGGCWMSQENPKTKTKRRVRVTTEV